MRPARCRLGTHALPPVSRHVPLQSQTIHVALPVAVLISTTHCCSGASGVQSGVNDVLLAS